MAHARGPKRAPRNTALATIAFALSVFASIGLAAAQTANPPPASQTQPAPPLDSSLQGPIVGGKDIQPRADQVPSPRLADDQKLRELYEGVMRDSDPSTYRNKREHI